MPVMTQTPRHPALVFDRELITRRRNRAAAEAPEHDFLLTWAADDIVERLSFVRRSFQTAVVLGAWHGVLGKRLREQCSIPLVIEQDAAAGMLAHCQGPTVLADEETVPFREGSLDLVASALSLQLVNDLPGTLIQIRRALRPDGLLLASVLGGRTLIELRSALLEAEAEIEGGASPRVAPFADVRDLGALLQRAGFALPVADAETLAVTYPSTLHLMRELRAFGAANPLLARRRSPLKRATLWHACEIYADRFPAPNGRVTATFEIVTLTGWAPHESQQRPLAPGSAQTRLADALGASDVPAGRDLTSARRSND